MARTPGSVRLVASAYIEPYWTPGGVDKVKSPPRRRYRVRARTGRVDPVTKKTLLLHLGSFPRLKEAEVRRDWAALQLARGKTPRLSDLFPDEAQVSLTVAAAIDRYLEQRPDLAEGTIRTYRSLVPHITRRIGSHELESVTPNDVRELVRACVGAKLGPDAIRSIRGVLAGAIDNEGVTPNVARDRTVKLPARKSERIDVPPAEHVCAILERLPSDLVLPIAMLEATGARVSEMTSVEHADVDRGRGMIRLVGKGNKVRHVPLPLELAELLPTVPPDQRATAGRLWPRLTADRARKAVATACTAAEIPHYTPHDLRHRYASRLVQLGVPITQVSLYMGHAKTSMTHDTYAQVIADVDEAWRVVLR